MTQILDPNAYDPRGGDHRSSPGRFGPLRPDDPSAGRACVVCGSALLVGDIPTLISLAPANVAEALKKARGMAYDAVARISHQDCAWPGEEGRGEEGSGT